MKIALAIMLICLFALGCVALPAPRTHAKAEEKPDAYEGYDFTPFPAFEQFDKSELSQLYMTGFDTRTADFTDELAGQGIPRALKLNVLSTGLKVVSTSRHLHVKDELFYDGLADVGGKTFNGGIDMSAYDGFMFRVDGYADDVVVIMRHSPCGGPYGFEGDAEHQALYDQYGIGPYYRTSTLFPDKNGYVKVEFGVLHGGYVWWEQGSLREEFSKFNSIDIIFGNQKINTGATYYISDFKFYKEPPSGRGLDELITKLEEYDADGSYASELATARNVLANGTEAQKKEQVRTLTLLLKPVLLRELYVNSYNSMKERITASGYSPTSVTGLYDGMFVRDTSIQSLMHTNQGDTDLSRRLLNYVLGVYRYSGMEFPTHIISDLRETEYGNNAGAGPGQYSALIKLGGSAYASQEISGDDATVTSVGVWMSRRRGARGMVNAELSRDGFTVGKVKLKASELPESKGYVVFEFGLPLNPVTTGNYTLTVSAPDSDEDSVVWYGRKNYKGLITKVNGIAINGEASYEAFKTDAKFWSDEAQTDTILVLAHAWFAYANAAPGTPEDAEFIAQSYPIIKQYVNAYVEGGFIDGELDLIRNDYLEHTRDGRKWECYDLITNAYASQVFHEFAEFDSALGNAEEAAKWNALSERIRGGINETLVTEVNGKRVYAELIDIANGDRFIKGMSWVNLAPIAAGWYGMDEQIMRDTFAAYREIASVNYGAYPMLDACYYMDTGRYGNHVIGKGYSWELMFSAAIGDTARVDEMTEFMLMNSPASNMYPESWWYPNRFSDVGNQEHSSWIAYAMATVYPELKDAVRRPDGDVDGDGEVTVTDALASLRMAIDPKEYYDSEKRLADIDGDGEATVSDTLRIMRRAAKLA